MRNLFGCFGLLLIFPIFVIGMILFNSWYLQVIYNIGLTPILSQFGLFIPQLGFWVFVLIDVTIGAIKYFFTNINTEKSETEKKTLIYRINDVGIIFSKIKSYYNQRIIQIR